MLELLRRIQAGQKVFTPETEGATPEDFNFIAHQLFQAAEDDLIIIAKHQKAFCEPHFFEAVFVTVLRQPASSF